MDINVKVACMLLHNIEHKKKTMTYDVGNPVTSAFNHTQIAHITDNKLVTTTF
jgi:hypothetical protein